MQFVADLHLHSKYSRAVSRDMVLPIMADYAKKKGIDILSTGDWTHPLWLREIKGQLEEAREGVYKIKNQKLNSKNTEQKSKIGKEPIFLLSVEVSSIYSQGGKLRRIHNLIFSPGFETAEKINKELVRRGCNLMSDGRPIIGLSAIQLLELVLAIDKTALLIPCHAWTPWFSLYGSNSGFDSIEECFGDYSKYIFGIETGLSSDPEMNWKIKELENRSILSFSDAHSPMKMGREATVFEISNQSLELSYDLIREAITKLSSNNQALRAKIAYTIEFYPEEGKYHYTGHRNCRVVQTPQETKEKGAICPVCKRPLTVGVEHRVQELADSKMSNVIRSASSGQMSNDEFGVRWINDPTGKHPPFVKLVPLVEIIAESLQSTPASVKVRALFDELCEHFGSEINILLKTEVSQIQKIAGDKIAEGIYKVRKGDIAVEPGFDGEYGKVRIWNNKEEADIKAQKAEQKQSQLGLEF